jgi:hypothetical protein
MTVVVGTIFVLTGAERYKHEEIPVHIQYVDGVF